MATDKENREHWLNEGATLIDAVVLAPNHVSAPLSAIKLSCGYPPHARGTRQNARTLQRSASQAHVNEIYINPKLADPRVILEVLAKHLVLARHDASAKEARADATLIGIVGSLNDERPVISRDLKDLLDELAAELPKYPHKPVDATKLEKDTTRQLLVICRDEDCEVLKDLGKNAKWRSSKEMIDYFVICPACASSDTEVSPSRGSYV